MIFTLQQQEQAIQDFLDNIDEEYEQLPRKQLFRTLDECCNETNYQHLEVQDEENKSYTYTSADKKFTREWHTKKERGVSGRAANQNILRGAE